MISHVSSHRDDSMDDSHQFAMYASKPYVYLDFRDTNWVYNCFLEIMRYVRNRNQTATKQLNMSRIFGSHIIFDCYMTCIQFAHCTNNWHAHPFRCCKTAGVLLLSSSFFVCKIMIFFKVLKRKNGYNFMCNSHNKNLKKKTKNNIKFSYFMPTW